MKRHLPMFAVLPILAMGALGFSGLARAGDGQQACRQYVPSAGLTIAVECGPPVAAVIKASTAVESAMCRRFIPSAQMLIEEPCPEPVAGVGDGAPGVAKISAPPVAQLPVAVEPSKTGKLETAKAVASKATVVAAKPVALKSAAAAGVNCAGIVERAQLGGETRHDLAMLREGCATGG